MKKIDSRKDINKKLADIVDERVVPKKFEVVSRGIHYGSNISIQHSFVKRVSGNPVKVVFTMYDGMVPMVFVSVWPGYNVGTAEENHLPENTELRSVDMIFVL
jgi:hypothetical protein